MKFFLDKKYIPQLPKNSDKWVTADTKEKAVHMFAVRIAKTKFAAHIWKAKLPDVKKEISSYVYLMKKEVSMEELLKELNNTITMLNESFDEAGYDKALKEFYKTGGKLGQWIKSMPVNPKTESIMGKMRKLFMEKGYLSEQIVYDLLTKSEYSYLEKYFS